LKTNTKPETELINTRTGRHVNRELLTGTHVVADVSCIICGTVLGWKYVDAKEAAQKYKIGKFILEMKRVVVAAGWEDGTRENEAVNDLGLEIMEVEAGKCKKEDESEGDIVFDSEDEDECDDLFAGVWDAEVIAKRKGRRVVRKKTIDTAVV
jgi:hypothetical protein